MNFYSSLHAAPMQLNVTHDLETLVQCAQGTFLGFRPQYVTPCIRRNESLVRIARRPECLPLHYTGWIMVELWSYNPDMLRHALKIAASRSLSFVSAAIPQPRLGSVVLLIHDPLVEDHHSYVAAHRLWAHRLRQLLPPALHVRPNYGNETQFLNLLLDCKCFLRQDSHEL